MVERIDKPMQFKDGQPVRTSSPEMHTRSSDTSIDEQTAATLPHFSQILKEDRYAFYVLLTFTFAVMWSNKSSPTLGPVCNTCSSLGSAGGPQIVSAGSSSNDIGFVRVDLLSYLMTSFENMIWCISISVHLLN